jgi:tRNA nucleotidyltransferase/poly(A) polymerase
VQEQARVRELIETSLPLLRTRHAQVWLVGGWVRDALLGHETHDIDFVVPEGALATARQVANALGGAFVPLDEQRDTARVVIGQGSSAVYLDLAGLRAPTIEGDLLARDFTVNAMAVPAEQWRAPQGHVVDPAGGQRDLELRVLRAVSPEGLREDPLRMMRAVRLGAALGFELDSETATWIQHDAELLDVVSRERVRDELAQMLELPGASRSMRQLQDLGLLAQIVPELAPLQQAACGETTVLDHSLRAVQSVDALRVWLAGGAWAGLAWTGEMLAEALDSFRERLGQHLATPLPGGRTVGSLLALAALVHDVGKGAGRPANGLSGGRILAHDVLGASMGATILRRLCYSSAETVRVRLIVGSHMRPGQIVQEGQAEPARRTIYRFFREAEPSGVDTILFSLADHLATRGGDPAPDHWCRHLVLSVALLEAFYERRHEVIDPPLLIDGRDLMAALSLTPGPELGELLDSVREAQAAGEVQTREQAIDLARTLLERGGPL